MTEAQKPEFQNDNYEQSLAPRAETAKHEPNGLTEDDFANVKALLGKRISDNTRANYGTQWRRFVDWAQDCDLQPYPASPEVVAKYLDDRMANEGHKPATLKAAAAAIGFIHRAAELPDPCASSLVKGVLSGAARVKGYEQKQAEALTAEALARIDSVIYEPRLSNGGRRERREEARRRGSVDMALMRLMRDGLLRGSEAEALLWSDLESVADGTGRLHIRHSKSDQEGEGVVLFVSAPTMIYVDAIRNGASPGDSIFGLGRQQISNRIKRAAVEAGLGNGFSSHSPRVGMARDLARAGIELNALMNAGRWKSPMMPARYTRNERAARGAVAMLYGHRPNLAA